MAARLAPAARTVYAAHSTFFVTTLDNLAAAHHANACEHVVGRRGVGDEGGVVATLKTETRSRLALIPRTLRAPHAAQAKACGHNRDSDSDSPARAHTAQQDREGRHTCRQGTREKRLHPTPAAPPFHAQLCCAASAGDRALLRGTRASDHLVTKLCIALVKGDGVSTNLSSEKTNHSPNIHSAPLCVERCKRARVRARTACAHGTSTHRCMCDARRCTRGA